MAMYQSSKLENKQFSFSDLGFSLQLDLLTVKLDFHSYYNNISITEEKLSIFEGNIYVRQYVCILFVCLFCSATPFNIALSNFGTCFLMWLSKNGIFKILKKIWAFGVFPFFSRFISILEDQNYGKIKQIRK